MEIIKGAEALVHDAVAVTRFIGERAIGGAWGLLARQVHFPEEVKPANIQVREARIIRGEE